MRPYVEIRTKQELSNKSIAARLGHFACQPRPTQRARDAAANPVARRLQCRISSACLGRSALPSAIGGPRIDPVRNIRSTRMARACGFGDAKPPLRCRAVAPVARERRVCVAWVSRHGREPGARANHATKIIASFQYLDVSTPPAKPHFESTESTKSGLVTRAPLPSPRRFQSSANLHITVIGDVLNIFRNFEDRIDAGIIALWLIRVPANAKCRWDRPRNNCNAASPSPGRGPR